MDDQRPETVGTPWWGFDPVEQEIRELQRWLGALHTALDSVLETHPRTGPGRWARPEGSIRPLDGAVAVDTALTAAFAVARERMLVPAWLEIKHPALAAHLDEIFTATWEQAGPLGPEPVPGRSPGRPRWPSRNCSSPGLSMRPSPAGWA